MQENIRLQATLELQNISMYYHSGTMVVPGIVEANLEFRCGEFVVITGESGSGKTTLLNIISALAPYHDGEMYINGNPTSAFGEEDWEVYRREHIGFVFQEYNLIKSYTVLENVMSAVLLRGIGEKMARELAKSYLNKVGLGDLLHRKSSKLSSGQKQRLAIARALAKDTDIIVADEPTGNLDSENGRQIVELLAELSKEKLVIMVSHNVEEAMQYATRRVRIHNSHVVADQKIKREELAEQKEEVRNTPEPVSVRKNSVTPFRLAWLNIKAQPLKSGLILLFMLLCTLAGGVFAAGYLAASDDTTTQIYSNEAFLNGDFNRMVVVREDGASMSMQDVELLRTLSHVEQVELYDTVADINYYATYDYDYKEVYEYRYYEGPWEGPAPRPKAEFLTFEFLKNENYVKSVTCITEEELAAGTMAMAANEIVCGSDPALIGTYRKVIVSDRGSWGTGQYAVMNFVITGVLEEDDGQIYFSEDACRMLLNNDGRYHVEFEAYEVYEQEITVRDMVYYVEAKRNESKADSAIVVLDYSLTGRKVSISEALFEVQIDGSIASNNVTNAEFDVVDSDRYLAGNVDISYYTKVMAEQFAVNKNSSKYVQMVSAELYQEIFPETPESKQITLYISDYAYTDDVLKKLPDYGYVGISVRRMSTYGYDQEKVTEQLITLFLCMGAFVGVYFLEIMIIRTFMKFKKGDYKVLRDIGMTQHQMSQMILVEFLLLAGVAVVLASILAGVVWTLGMEMVYNMMKYLRWYHYVSFMLLELMAAVLLALSYSNYLKKQFGMKSAKELR